MKFKIQEKSPNLKEKSQFLGEILRKLFIIENIICAYYILKYAGHVTQFIVHFIVLYILAALGSLLHNIFIMKFLIAFSNVALWKTFLKPLKLHSGYR